MDTCHVMGDTSGLSMVELMIVLVLSLFLMAAVYASSQAGRKTSVEQHQVMALQQELRAVMDMMETDIHNAGCDPLLVNDNSGTVFGITAAGTTSLTFSGDLNMDGVLDEATEKLTYEFADRTLNRSTYVSSGLGFGKSPVPVLSNVTAFQLAYYDKDDAQTSSISSIRSVEVLMRVSDAKGMFNRQLSRRIQLRNMGL